MCDNGKFIGKFRFDGFAETDKTIELDNVVEIQQVLIAQGAAIISTLLGSAQFDKSKIIATIDLDSKSPFYTEYYKATSGLTLQNKM